MMDRIRAQPCYVADPVRIGHAASGVVPAPHSQLSPISEGHVTILYSPVSSWSMLSLVSFVIMFSYTR